MIFVFRSVPFRLVGEDVSERVSEWDDGRAGGRVCCVCFGHLDDVQGLTSKIRSMMPCCNARCYIVCTYVRAKFVSERACECVSGIIVWLS